MLLYLPLSPFSSVTEKNVEPRKNRKSHADEGNMSSFLSLDTQTTNTAPALHTQHCCTPIFFVWLSISDNSAESH